jgi:hypothetical protein
MHGVEVDCNYSTIDHAFRWYATTRQFVSIPMVYDDPKKPSALLPRMMITWIKRLLRKKAR